MHRAGENDRSNVSGAAVGGVRTAVDRPAGRSYVAHGQEAAVKEQQDAQECEEDAKAGQAEADLCAWSKPSVGGRGPLSAGGNHAAKAVWPDRRTLHVRKPFSSGRHGGGGPDAPHPAGRHNSRQGGSKEPVCPAWPLRRCRLSQQA